MPGSLKRNSWKDPALIKELLSKVWSHKALEPSRKNKRMQCWKEVGLAMKNPVSHSIVFKYLRKSMMAYVDYQRQCEDGGNPREEIWHPVAQLLLPGWELWMRKNAKRVKTKHDAEVEEAVHAINEDVLRQRVEDARLGKKRKTAAEVGAVAASRREEARRRISRKYHQDVRQAQPEPPSIDRRQGHHAAEPDTEFDSDATESDSESGSESDSSAMPVRGGVEQPSTPRKHRSAAPAARSAQGTSRRQRTNDEALAQAHMDLYAHDPSLAIMTTVLTLEVRNRAWQRRRMRKMKASWQAREDAARARYRAELRKLQAKFASAQREHQQQVSHMLQQQKAMQKRIDDSIAHFKQTILELTNKR